MKTIQSVLILTLLTPLAVTAQDEYKKAYNAALEFAKDATTYAEARNSFADAALGADEASDSEIGQRARYAAAQIDYKLGTSAYRSNDFEAALQHYTNGNEIYPAYIKNLYGQGLTLMSMERVDEALETLRNAAAAPGDRKTNLAAEKRIRGHFIGLASSALGKNNVTSEDADIALGALESLSEILQPDADLHYYTAVAHYQKGNGTSAIESANEALAIHKGSLTDKAKIYYVLGEAYVSINNTDAAKDAFREALYGSYKQSAEHYLENL